MKKRTNKWVEFSLCLCLGYLGVHKFYSGSKYAKLWLCTFGLFGIGWMIDTIILLCQALIQSTPTKKTTINIPHKTDTTDIRRTATTEVRKPIVQNLHLTRADYFKKLLAIDPADIRCLDIETTGLNKINDDILQLSIIDGNGNILFSDYIRPVNNVSWPEAERIHGISPQMVAFKRTIDEHRAEIDQIMASAKVVIGYNSNGFDVPFLKNKGIVFPEDAEYVDVMLLFAQIYGEWNEYHGNYRWQKLTTCANYYGYEFQAHDALEDIKATLFCYYKIAENYASEQ